MTVFGEKLLAAAREASKVARGETPAYRIYHNGHHYVPEEGRRWLPIDTAPTDHGARFLTWSPDVGCVVCDRFSPSIVTAWDQQPYSGATHWMPIPPPPEAGE